ncbi:outer membrane protein assembly factor BamA [Helicobacter cappadocius]|uniref:Outer membrane protein assembly factor BamA n=1 Tax=Helicobacter cappadocius TaxID=3063998 RepID=A0AA90Q183_9HELI|nr:MULTISPECIES: outer membrane protein assembly factor BamA [unclassified Helicobacter]MDO7252406.1 outer membrane protein assembly factor BamA [Helicobacter sp. faydin-H75]MDP2538273.1 outer membrane protein assembly factor BamA [Helicobacter sp. faydin-H76]
MRKLYIKKILALLLFFGFSVLYAEKIKNIEYDGLLYMSPMLAGEVTDIQEGDTLDDAKLDKAILALYNQGYFKDIYATFENGTLTFHFTEKPRVASIEIKGYGTEQEKETLYTQMGIKKGDTFDDQKLEKAKNILKTILEYQGYYGTVIETDITPVASSGAYAIIMNVNRGDNILITKATYEGREKLKVKDLQSLSANKQRDFMGWMWGLNDGKLHLNDLEYDSLRIQDVYMRHGFLDANVSSPFLDANFSNYSASLYYKITEGTQYKVSDIEITIDDEVVPIKKLLKAIKVKKGEIFNIENLRADTQILKREVADKGYAFAVVKPDLDKNEAGGEVKVLYHIEVGDKVHISDVLISGNTRTSDRIIRREILLAPGDEYSLSKVHDSENALRRLGFFDNVKIEERRVSENSMDLLVNVQEGRTGQLQFGLGYGSYGGLMINGSVSERNLFGTGQSGSIYANIATGTGSTYSNPYGGTSNGRQFSGNISLSNPRIFDSRYSASENLYANYYVNYQYVEQSGGFGLTAGRLLTNTLRVSLGYDINVTKTYDFSSPLYERYYASNKQIIYDAQGNPFGYGIWDRDYHIPIASSITPSISFDNTDDYYFPKNGIIASAYAQFNGVGGNVRNTKVYAKFAAYYHLKRIIPIDLIARYKAQGGYIFRYTPQDFLAINNTFYMGGVSTIRGFQSGSVSPRDPYGLWVGGDGLFTNSVELSYGVLEAAKMRISAYFDYGFLTYKGYDKAGRPDIADFQNYGIPGKGIEHLEWRAATGLALEWVSPMGPIVLVFPIKVFNKQPGDYTSNFEFTMGTRF